MITIICLDNDLSKKERRAYRVEETDNYYQLSRIFIDHNGDPITRTTIPKNGGKPYETIVESDTIYPTDLLYVFRAIRRWEQAENKNTVTVNQWIESIKETDRKLQKILKTLL